MTSTNRKDTMSTPAPTAAPVVSITLDTPIGGWLYGEDGEPVGRGRTIADAIISEATDRLVAKLRDEVLKLVREQVKEQIHTQVGAVIAEVIATPVQLTNTFGEPTGHATSVREHVAKEVKDQLANRRDTYGKGTVLADLIKNEVEQALRKELKGSIETAREQVIGAVKAQAAALIGQAVKDGLR